MPPLRLSRAAYRLGIGVALFAAIALHTTRATAQPRVVASIPPVHSLVASVMAGRGQPALLVSGGASPHSYVLRPSDARLLQRADVVFWVGPTMELFLVKPLQALAGSAHVVALATAPGVALLPQRAGGAWEAHDQGHEADGEEHGHGADYNPHVWLDPRNAQAMVRSIVATLSAADPVGGPAYAANGATLLQRLRSLDAELAQTLAPVRTVPYIVFHDAYPYLEQRYGLNAVGSVTVSPDQRPGVRRITALRERLRASGAACVFTEPQFQPRLVATLVEGTNVRVAQLDPLGSALEPGPGQYSALMRGLAQSLVACLAPGR